MKNTIYVAADSRKNEGQEEFKYEKILLLEDFTFNNFLRGIIKGEIFVDFDARTGHNHGTKFRIKQNNWNVLYSKVTELKQ
ncbi:MAG: MvaI/BcnI family restriction endonuclease [Elusimicrobiota bacterium]